MSAGGHAAGARRPPGERVRVTRSRPLSGTGGLPRRPAPSPAVASTYERDLRRAQLRWSIAALLAVAGPLLALPAGFALLPGLALLPVLGLPLGWLLLAAAVYPLVWLGGRWYLAGAERTERDYTELAGGEEPGTSPGEHDPGPRGSREGWPPGGGIA